MGKGKEIALEHKYAVVFAEETSFEMIGPAPHIPAVMESSKSYAKGAYISVQLAAYIANLGYAATANHFRHYEAILPPLAVDAGFGEIGRLGYLMTKEYGPRIRLSAVTTDLPSWTEKSLGDIWLHCLFLKNLNSFLYKLGHLRIDDYFHKDNDICHRIKSFLNRFSNPMD